MTTWGELRPQCTAAGELLNLNRLETAWLLVIPSDREGCRYYYWQVNDQWSEHWSDRMAVFRTRSEARDKAMEVASGMWAQARANQPSQRSRITAPPPVAILNFADLLRDLHVPRLAPRHGSDDVLAWPPFELPLEWTDVEPSNPDPTTPMTDNATAETKGSTCPSLNSRTATGPGRSRTTRSSSVR